MSLPSDPDQTGIEFAGVPDSPDPTGAILEEGIPDTSGDGVERTDDGADEPDDADDDEPDAASAPGDARPDWRDFSSEILEPDQSQPFGDKAPDDLRD
ncbi:hypothetical protein ITJ64_12875 [Herbiconiux sp. VKM Ac-1786]|uniref:hypothetical protein n=1 Tax=Herbiconiux sp. VKM Ac-1786 TaxID=2783824 RepID=UPI00188C7F75|nr:hypothetical protein [Herbiconiux sp. VKM Ac-1786]MBF4573412.1 hypothetical protein [Herbiconiux sp. VKM Ac-1786]